MKICLCDDDITQLDYLKFLIHKWQEARKEVCDITTYENAEALLFENTHNFPFDFMLLDIQMGNINGIELAKKIREIDKKIEIAFLSGISTYVFEGYEVYAIRYLLKPINEKSLFEVLDIVKAKKIKEPKYLIINKLGANQKINYNDIYYIESFGHYILIHTAVSIVYKILMFLQETRSIIMVTNRPLSSWKNMKADTHIVETLAKRLMQDA